MDGRTDQYALACAAFAMFTGEPPFTRDQAVGVMWAQMSSEPPTLTSRRPDLPAAVDGVMARALAKSAGSRYATCPEFAVALRRACGLGRASGRPPARPGPAVPAQEETGAPPAHPMTVAAAAAGDPVSRPARAASLGPGGPGSPAHPASPLRRSRRRRGSRPSRGSQCRPGIPGRPGRRTPTR